MLEHGGKHGVTPHAHPCLLTPPPARTSVGGVTWSQDHMTWVSPIRALWTQGPLTGSGEGTGPESVQGQAQNPFREGWEKDTPSWEEEAQNLGGWGQPLRGLKERPDGATTQNGARAEKTGPRKQA